MGTILFRGDTNSGVSGDVKPSLAAENVHLCSSMILENEVS